MDRCGHLWGTINLPSTLVKVHTIGKLSAVPMKLIYMGCWLKLVTELTFREGYFPSILLALFWSDVQQHFENAPFVGPATPSASRSTRKLPSPAIRETTRRPAPRKRARLGTSGKQVRRPAGQAPSAGTRAGTGGRWALGRRRPRGLGGSGTSAPALADRGLGVAWVTRTGMRGGAAFLGVRIWSRPRCGHRPHLLSCILHLHLHISLLAFDRYRPAKRRFGHSQSIYRSFNELRCVMSNRGKRGRKGPNVIFS